MKGIWELLQGHYNTATRVGAKLQVEAALSLMVRPGWRRWMDQKTVILKCRNFLGFWRKSPMSRRKSPVNPVRLS